MTSRAERLETAKEEICSAQSQVEELRDELQNWLDNMPENLQGGSKADELEEAISALEEIIDSLENASGVSVEFPSMF